MWPPTINANVLEQIGFSTLPGNRVQVYLTFSQDAPTPISFSTENPARISLDFPNVRLGLRDKAKDIGVGVVQGANAAETTSRSRIVIRLVRMVPFEINTIGNRVLIAIDNMGAQTSTTPNNQPLNQPSLNQQPSVSLPTSSSTPPPIQISQDNFVQDIDFRRTQDGAGRIAITLSNPSIIVDMRRESNDIILEIPKTQLPNHLNRRLDVLDFATPISFIDTFPVSNDIRMNITIADNGEYHAYQTENIYVVEVKEKVLSPQEEIDIEERKYEGQLVSFNFQNIDIRAALSLLFDLPGVNLNMVAGEEVRGSVTLRLKNIPWDQALDIILEARDLGMRKIGNVVIIDLKKNLDEREQRTLEAQKKIKELEPLRTEFIVINYAKAADFASLLRTKGEHSFLSNRGNISMDERTNTLIIQDTASKIAEIRKLITSLDTPVRQVLIESRLVIANRNFSKGLGVKFGYSANEDLGYGNGIVFGGKTGGDTQFSAGTGFTSDNTTTSGDGENFIVSLPAVVEGATPAAVGLAIGKIGSYLLQLELSAMQTEGVGEIISSPRVITGNQQEAVITQGTEIPYVQSAGVGAVAQVQFKPAVLELKVIPQITPDDRINMELSVKKDSEGQRLNGNVSIDKREVKTKVLVKNGETVVLGGVYERTKSNTLDRVPFFSELPLIGNLFKRRSSRDDKSELLIFVTPKILKEAT
jgi:type IV pilus assembly protein PilQ